MKKSWLLSLMMSFALLGGAVLPTGASVSAASDTTPVYSDENSAVTEDTIGEDTSADEPEFTEDEADLLDYVDQLEAAAVYEERAFNSFKGGMTITSANRKSIFLKLNNTAIPNYTKYVSKLKLIKPKNAELQKIHAKLVKGSYTQLEAYQLFKKSVSKTKVNSTQLKQGNDKLAAGAKLIEQSNQEFIKYANNLGFDL